MRLYALNYATIDSAQSEWDDPSSKDSSLGDFAAPQVAALAIDETLEAKIAAVKTMAEDERKSTDPEDADLASEEYVWEDMGWVHSDNPCLRSNKTLMMYSTHTVPELIAVLVVQLVEGEKLS